MPKRQHNAIKRLEEDVAAYKAALKSGGHPEDMESWRHELHIAQRKLAEARRQHQTIKPNYPDTAKRATTYLRDDSDLDLTNATAQADPVVEGVWKITTPNESDVEFAIVYLAGYRDPWGLVTSVRPSQLALDAGKQSLVGHRGLLQKRMTRRSCRAELDDALLSVVLRCEGCTPHGQSDRCISTRRSDVQRTRP